MVARIILTSLLLLVPLCATPSTLTLPKTGQTLCYDAKGIIDCAGTGQDGETQAGATWPTLRFTNNNNGTVTDNLTGLTWLQDPSCTTLNPPPANPTLSLQGGRDWASALTAANTLKSGQCGLTDGSVIGDWRLPNINELESLMDLSKFNPPLPANNHFINIPQDAPNYWTSSITGDYYPGTNAIGADMFTGTIQGDVKTNQKNVWPVKGDSTSLAQTGQNACWDLSGNVTPCNGSRTDGDLRKGLELPNPRFFDNGNGTNTDSLTGLIWPQNTSCFSNISSQGQAITAAKTLANGACGLTDGSLPGDWRVPNRKELRSLADYGRAWLDAPEFTSAPHGWYWTSDSLPVSTFDKWMVKSQGLDWLASTLLTYQQLPPYFMLPVRGGLKAQQSGTVTITPADLIRTYDGTPKAVTATTSPAGMTLAFTYAGSATPPTKAGTYPVVATITDPGYQGNIATGNLVIAQAVASVTLDNLSQVYDGTAKSATATTMPAGLAVTFSYTPANPINVGSYQVDGTVSDDNYSGTASGTITVTKQTPTVTWHTPAAIASGTALSATQLNATGSVPGSFVYTPPAGTVPRAGTQTLSALFTPTDTTNFKSASASVLLTVAPNFTVTFDPGSGSLTGTASQSVAEGASTSAVTAVPASGFHFVQWSGPGSFSSTSNPLIVANVTADQTLTANYAVDTFLVTSSAPGGNGGISCTSPVNYHANCTCTITPDAGYHISTLTDNDADQMSAVSGGTFIITNVTSNHVVSTTFARPNGILNPAAGKTLPDIRDALAVLQMVLRITPCTAADIARADIAPLGSDNRPSGNGTLDIYDVIGILRMAIGL